MRRWFLVVAVVVCAALLAVLGVALASAAQSSAQLATNIADQEPPKPADGTNRVYLPLIWAGGADQGTPPPAVEPGPIGGEDADDATPTPESLPTLSPEPPVAPLPVPTEVRTDTQPVADLPVLTHCGAITANETWVGGYVHRVTCGVTINSDVVLTVAAGAVVKFDAGQSLTVNGTLNATGTADNLTYITSIKDDTVGGDTNGDGSASSPAPGDWLQVYVANGKTATFTHTVLRYGGNASGNQGMLYLYLNAVATLDHSTVARSATQGIHLYAYNVLTRLTLTSAIIEDNAANGVYANTIYGGQHQVAVSNSTFRHNGDSGLNISQPVNTVIYSSSITGNVQFGVRNGTPGTPIDARNNWWGDPSGPQHSSLNPGGKGSGVSDGVQIDPWLVTPPTVRLPGELALGEMVEDVIWLNRYNDYRIQTAGGVSLLVQVTPLAGSNALWVYGKAGDVPVYTRFDLRAQDLTPHGTYDMLISPAQPGQYVLSVYGRDVAATGGRYSIVARVLDRYLSDIAPRTAGNAGTITLRMTGLGLAESGITARLTRNGVPDRVATEVTRESETALLARFDLKGAAAGVYDVVLAWPDGHTETLPAAFEITPGVGPKLETRITAPESVRPGRQYMVHVDYSNTGDADMAAPLLRITAENASLKLPEEESFLTPQIQMYGINDEGQANVLPPGASARLSLIFQPRNTGGAVQLAVAQLRDRGAAAGVLPDEPADTRSWLQPDDSSLALETAARPEGIIVANERFVAREMIFLKEIQAMLDSQPGPLKNARFQVNGEMLTGAELLWKASLVQDMLFEEQHAVGLEFDLDPRLVIALADSLTGAVSQPVDATSQAESPLPNPEGLLKLTRELGLAYINPFVTG